MRLSRDEKRALGFVVLLLVVAFGARLRESPVQLPDDMTVVELAAAVDSVERAVASHQVAPLEEGERIDVNRAPAEELRRLPRIGPALAERVITVRREEGPFRDAADLIERVPGVGARTVEALEPHLEFGAASGLSGAPAGLDTRRGALLDLNRASAAELEALPGIGPVIAGRIVAHRQTYGRFNEVADLEAVSGVGPATLERIAEYVTTGRR